MTSTLMKLPVYVALALGVLLTGGCVKYKQIVTLMPDGSGKIEYIIGLNQQALQQQAGEEDPRAQFSPDAISDDTKGIVAYSEPVKYTEDGWSYVSFAGYFNNINEVQISSPEDDTESTGTLSFAYEPADGGATLTVTGSALILLAGNYQQPPAEERQWMHRMWSGMEMSEQYVLPGEAEPAVGMAMVDNTAELRIDLDSFLENKAPLPSLKGRNSYTLELPELVLPQDQIDAFKAEMAEAIEKWEQKQAEQDDK